MLSRDKLSFQNMCLTVGTSLRELGSISPTEITKEQKETEIRNILQNCEHIHLSSIKFLSELCVSSIDAGNSTSGTLSILSVVSFGVILSLRFLSKYFFQCTNCDLIATACSSSASSSIISPLMEPTRLMNVVSFGFIIFGSLVVTNTLYKNKSRNNQMNHYKLRISEVSELLTKLKGSIYNAHPQALLEFGNSFLKIAKSPL